MNHKGKRLHVLFPTNPLHTKTGAILKSDKHRQIECGICAKTGMEMSGPGISSLANNTMVLCFKR